MEEKIIVKNKRDDFIQELKKEYRIFSPIEKEGDFRFTKLQDTNYGVYSLSNYRNTKISPKEILFPQDEVLFSFTENKIQTNNNQQQILIFNIRPCDVQALLLLAKVFIDHNNVYIDPYFQMKQEHTTIISLACNNPQITCFCTSVGGKPDEEKGSDIILFDLDENIFIKSVTKKGEKLIKDFDKWFENAKKSDIEKKNKLMNLAYKKLPTTNYRLQITNYDASFWSDIHKKCFGCAICTYLCPTCYCFDITDEVIKEKGKRIRCWDSCMFSSFTLHASGHQPRPTYKERMRQRIMHKFNYCLENFKEIFCVGCGRCIRNCPVSLDIREILIS